MSGDRPVPASSAGGSGRARQLVLFVACAAVVAAGFIIAEVLLKAPDRRNLLVAGALGALIGGILGVWLAARPLAVGRRQESPHS